VSTTRTKRKQPGSVAFVGAGPGDERLLTLRGAELLAGTDVLVGDPALLEAHGHHCRVGVELRAIDPADPPAVVAKLLAAAAREGRRVVRLVDGDPGLGYAAVREIDACAKAKIVLEIVPGVSDHLGVAAYMGVLPAGRRSGVVALVDADAASVDWEALVDPTTTVVASGSPGALADLAVALAARGRSGAPAAVTVAGTTTVQRTVDVDLEAAAGRLAALTERRAVLVVGDAVAVRERYSWFETRPLFGWKVLVPRTKEQAVGLSERLRSYGAVPVEVPTIAVEPPRTPQAMDRAINGLVSGRYQWIAFTSTNAVRAVREKVEELGLDARAFAGVRVAVVGEITAAAVQAWGIRPDLVPAAQQSSEGLLADWPDYEPGLDPLDRVFLPRADIATETLAAGLLERGWQIDDVTAYRTVRAAPPPAETREAIKTGGFDAVLFTSSSTVRNLVGIAGKPHASTVIAVIGPQTAKTAEELGLRVDVMAGSASALVLADGLAEFGSARRLANEHEPPGKANRSRPAARPVKKAK